MNRFTMMTLSVAAALFSSPLLLASPQDDERARLELEATLASLNERGLLASGNEKSTQMRAPAQQRWELGAVLDVAEAGNLGPRVLAVTPDGPAARMGLRVDDRVSRINGIEIRGGARAASRLMAAMSERDGDLSIEAFRNGELITLEGTADSLAIPGYTITIDTGAAPNSDCGRLTVYPWRRVNERIWPVVLHAINGRWPGSENQFQFKLAPGRHVLKLTEQITDVRLNDGFRRNALARRNKDLREFVMDIEPGMTYRIGARFIVEQADQIENGGYWEPVVWRSFGQSCRGAIFPSPAALH